MRYTWMNDYSVTPQKRRSLNVTANGPEYRIILLFFVYILRHTGVRLKYRHSEAVNFLFKLFIMPDKSAFISGIERIVV